MRYDNGYGRDYGGWQGRGPRYDEMFRGMQGRGEGPPNWRRGRDAGRMGWRDLPPAYGPGPGPHPQWHEHPAPGETDFLGRPYPPASMDDRPWGLLEQDKRQARYAGPPRGYDRGYRGYDRAYGRGYDRGFSARPRYGADYPRPDGYHYTSNYTRWF